jgi:hypothetical protein
VARAGTDTTIVLGQTYFLMDGSGSYDSLNRPMQFEWRLINGPYPVSFNGMNAIASVVFNSTGEYSFQIKVTAGMCASYDTTKITVIIPAWCQQTREQIPVQFNTISQLPVPITFPLVFALNNKLIVTSKDPYSYAQPNILIYDLTTSQWTTTQLNEPRWGMTIIAAGTKVFFAGGMTYDNDYNVIANSRIDIYDVASQTWTVSNLSEPRAFIKAIELEGEIYFAGGLKSGRTFSNKIDIYSAQSNDWSTAILPGTPRVIIGAATADNKLFFCGGYTEFADYTGFGEVLNIAVKDIDIYNVTSGNWTSDTMQAARSSFGAFTHDNKLYLAGGIIDINQDNYPETLDFRVEIKDVNDPVHSTSCLFQVNTFGNDNLAKKNNHIVFMGDNMFTSTTPGKIDIYDTQTGSWKIGLLPANMFDSYKTTVVSINNQIYVVNQGTLYTMSF